LQHNKEVNGSINLPITPPEQGINHAAEDNHRKPLERVITSLVYKEETKKMLLILENTKIHTLMA